MSTYAEVNLLPSASGLLGTLDNDDNDHFHTALFCFEMTHCACVACDSKSDCSFL